jgi:hypothetical protein
MVQPPTPSSCLKRVSRWTVAQKNAGKSERSSPTRCGLTAASALMIDDKLENIAVALRLGVVTHRFHSGRELRDCLESVSLLPTGSLTRGVDV